LPKREVSIAMPFAFINEIILKGKDQFLTGITSM